MGLTGGIMSLPISLHVICRHENPLPRGLKPLDLATGEHESVSWLFDRKYDALLPGKIFALHDKKSSPSYFGGRIIRIERRQIEDNNNAERAVIIFVASREGKGLAWPPTTNPNEIVGFGIG